MGKSGAFLLSIGEAESFSGIWSDVFLLSLAYALLEWGFGGLMFVAFLLELWT